MARPKKPINEKLFDTVIQLPLLKEDIAKIMEIGEATLDRYVKSRFGISYEVLRAQNEQSFRKNILGKQYELAMKGNVTLLIWLGKQYLDQSDKVDNTHRLKDPYQQMTEDQLIAEQTKIRRILENEPKKINTREVKEVERSETPSTETIGTEDRS